jgi:hypothetical protein
VTLKGVELQNLGAIAPGAAQKQFDSLITNTNSGVPYLAKFQVLDPKGSYNNYNSVDPKLTQLIDDASALPADKSEDALITAAIAPSSRSAAIAQAAISPRWLRSIAAIAASSSRRNC